jgi:6-pyruvoyltetrahydropterin/6-carboxytetrahydropterin synthase
MYEITVSKVFSAAHAIRLPDGSLEPIHGHDWSVTVTVGANQLDEIETVMDFHVLEKQLDDIIEGFNNRCLNEVAPFLDGSLNPTAERVAEWIGKQIAVELPKNVRLIGSSVTEAPGCKSTYRPSG